jgi:hypothetical protein
LQLRIVAPFARCVADAERLRAQQEETNMRMIETAAVGLVALAAQVLVVATVLI